jgi:hypothetical protein
MSTATRVHAPNTTAGESTTAGVAWVELSAIFRRAGNGLVCRFAEASGRSWSVPVTPADLQTFAKFQACVAKALSLWVRHECEQERTARKQRDEWRLSVECAWRAGGK